VNVPALARGSAPRRARAVDINRELAAHGAANLLAAALGTVQNYMVYSSSVLYRKCGGGSRAASGAVALALFAGIPYVSSLIPFLPRLLAGLLLVHLGLELVLESLVSTWKDLDSVEYAIVLGIAGTCNVSFVGGFLVGLLCACIAFAVESARSDPVESAFHPGRGIRSSKMRCHSDLRALEAFEQEGGFFILRLRGALFFGNTHALPRRIQGLSCKFVIMDFHHVVAIDSSALCQLESMACALAGQGIELLCSGLLPDLLAKVRRQPHLAAARGFPDVNAALDSMERQVLQRVSGPPAQLQQARAASARDGIGRRSAAPPSEGDCRFFDDTCSQLLLPLTAAAGEDPLRVSAALRGYFEFQRARQGTVLWEPRDEADFAFLLVSGHVGVLDGHCDRCRGPLGGLPDQHFVECSEPGQFTGELNLFTGETRKNRILATKDLSMWTLTRSRLEQMREADMHLAFAFQGIVLRYASHRMYVGMLDGHVHTV